jgi:hypothetical protein
MDLYRQGERMLMRRPTRTVTLCVVDVLWLDGIACTQLLYATVGASKRWPDLRGRADRVIRLRLCAQSRIVPRSR